MIYKMGAATWRECSEPHAVSVARAFITQVRPVLRWRSPCAQSQGTQA